MNFKGLPFVRELTEPPTRIHLPAEMTGDYQTVVSLSSKSYHTAGWGVNRWLAGKTTSADTTEEEHCMFRQQIHFSIFFYGYETFPTPGLKQQIKKTHFKKRLR